ncbi:hypothetical protein VNO80_07495 [Phaseolus coccineus]|uniref:Uncharacterized protein n=1 Tax=Phaseolus coccineus TaxID=3886 RepID=A0AAN9NJ25_PHACN
MQSERQEQQQSWRLHVTAKANNFNFRLRFAAATYKPTWNFSFFRLSILLKLPKFALTFASHPTQPVHRPGFFTTKFMKIVRKLRPRWPRKKESNVPYLKDPLRNGFWVMGILECVARSISKNGHRGIVMLVGYLLLLFWKMKIAKLVNLVTFLGVVGTIFYYLFFNFDCNYSYWEYMGRSWNKMVNLW